MTTDVAAHGVHGVTDAQSGKRIPDDAVDRALTAFARALELLCLAARHPARAALANEAVVAHVEARAWAEEAVRRAASARPAECPAV